MKIKCVSCTQEFDVCPENFANHEIIFCPKCGFDHEIVKKATHAIIGAVQIT